MDIHEVTSSERAGVFARRVVDRRNEPLQPARLARVDGHAWVGAVVVSFGVSLRMTRPPITTKQQARKLALGLLTRASLLRVAGFNRLGTEEKKRLADELEDAGTLIRRMVNGPMVPVYDQTADDDASEADLFGGAA